MIDGRIRDDLEPNWARDDPTVSHRSGWPVHSGTGATDAAVTYFEIDPGHHIGRHEHDASETVLLLAGRGRAVVEAEERSIAPGDLVHVPAGVTHDVVNEGDEKLELVGFFAKADVKTVFEQVQMPDETTELGSPG
ncbi:MAG TPA: cupin domain-containing protein [Actinomycetota bacterium]|jgi:quercetin dioxygenase-like cupin family protein